MEEDGGIFVGLSLQQQVFLDDREQITTYRLQLAVYLERVQPKCIPFSDTCPRTIMCFDTVQNAKRRAATANCVLVRDAQKITLLLR